MNPTPDLNAAPLDDDDLDRLDLLLQRCADPEDGIPDLEMLDGFLSAVLVGPAELAPESWLPAIWGSEGARRDARQMAEAQGLIARLAAQILRRVSIDPDERPGGRDSAFPLLGMPAEDEDASGEAGAAGAEAGEDAAGFPFAAAWALGFMRAAALDEAAWDGWAEDHEDIASDLAVVMQLAIVDAEQARDAGLEVDSLLTEDERFDLAYDLPDLLHGMFLQRLHDRRPAPARREALPGRNDPCHCGSGRKFKKCCGATAAS
ncbi:UPF0149 family protein [Coralloluteibacterium stylophorae]|uniref:UPF0149 family protein n=1 Tax=Coralloluteibacterium stylophorae TaxID=1776034 RepID=A0A8J8AZC4_9GAMM|nr:UPF0149 family protein [Coralloluteibacterium stylophorae]MBS7458031.1 UPF0149 family protein [Coralloluteibacterium stylophorae]